MKQVVLTGIKPTGTPHIGNYFGAIKQAIELSDNLENDNFYSKYVPCPSSLSA